MKIVLYGWFISKTNQFKILFGSIRVKIKYECSKFSQILRRRYIQFEFRDEIPLTGRYYNNPQTSGQLKSTPIQESVKI